MSMDVSKWITPKEAAAALGYEKADTAVKLVKARQLRAIDRRVGGNRARYLIDPASVEEFKQRRLVNN
jgi:hypothetical protein